MNRGVRAGKFADMRRIRFRLAGAVLATTLLLSLAEAAWAGSCDPAMAEMVASKEAGMAGMAGMPSGHECPPGHGHDHDGTEGGDTNCPFAPAAGIGCAASASLPAIATAALEPPPVRVLLHLPNGVVAHDRHALAIFHPPKV